MNLEHNLCVDVLTVGPDEVIELGPQLSNMRPPLDVTTFNPIEEPIDQCSCKSTKGFCSDFAAQQTQFAQFMKLIYKILGLIQTNNQMLEHTAALEARLHEVEEEVIEITSP